MLQLGDFGELSISKFTTPFFLTLRAVVIIPIQTLIFFDMTLIS